MVATSLEPELDSKDYYKVLGIKRNASAVQIKAAYRKLAIKYHPDKNVNNVEEAEENFKVVGKAYACLSDPENKEYYDKFGVEMCDQEEFTWEMAKKLFSDSFHYGEAYDEENPDSIKGIKRASVGVLYAPAKGVYAGVSSLLTGAVVASGAVVVGAGACVYNLTSGVKEMGDAGVIAAKAKYNSFNKKNSKNTEEKFSEGSLDEDIINTKLRQNSIHLNSNTQKVAKDDVEEEKADPKVFTDEKEKATFIGGLKKAAQAKINSVNNYMGKDKDSQSTENDDQSEPEKEIEEPYVPTFMGGFKKATLGAVSAPVKCVLAGGGVLLGSGVVAGGFIAGGCVGAKDNFSSGMKEYNAAKVKGKPMPAIMAASDIKSNQDTAEEQNTGSPAKTENSPLVTATEKLNEQTNPETTTISSNSKETPSLDVD